MNLSSDNTLITYLKSIGSPRALYLLSVILPLAALAFAFQFSAPSLLPAPVAPQPLAPPEPLTPQDGYTRLSVLSLFTPRPAQMPAVKQQEEGEEQMLNAPESALPLTVTGLLSSHIDSHSMAIVQQNQQQVTLSVGDTLPATTATIVRIFPQRVIIRHQGRLEALTLK